MIVVLLWVFFFFFCCKGLFMEREGLNSICFPCPGLPMQGYLLMHFESLLPIMECFLHSLYYAKCFTRIKQASFTSHCPQKTHLETITKTDDLPNKHHMASQWESLGLVENKPSLNYYFLTTTLFHTF